MSEGSEEADEAADEATPAPRGRGRRQGHPAVLEKARQAPTLPGVYMFKDGNGTVLYVGKSVSLRQRVASYIQASRTVGARIARMVARAADLEFFVTNNEEEALLLEYEFITRYTPRFNIVFRDDKTYPYLKVTHEEFPRILFTRAPGQKHKGPQASSTEELDAVVRPRSGRIAKQSREPEGDVLGPFASADAVRRTLRFMRSLFPVRSCSAPSEKLHTLKLCLDYHIKRCLGPCEHKVDAAAYGQVVKSARLFLSGKDEELVSTIRVDMEDAASRWDFEKAQRLKRQLDALERLHTRQGVARTSDEDADAVAIAGDGQTRVIQQVQLRGGRVAGQRRWVLKKTTAESGELLGEWLKQHYLARDDLPPRILIPSVVPDQDVLTRVLSGRAGRKVDVFVPQRGSNRGLIDMAARNALLHLSALEGVSDEGVQATRALGEVLALARTPRVVECFDISHTGGNQTVASMVVARDGVMDRSSYRRFKIRSVDGIDDFASMREVVTRRYGRLLADGQDMPDLVLIDGGKGQLSAARESLIQLGLGGVALASLAKEQEILFSPSFPEGLALPAEHTARRLVQRIRDEAHRFAVTYHRLLRSKRTTRSQLDDIVGIGPVMRRRLLRHFGSVTSIKSASLEELTGVKGVNQAASRAVWDHFHP